jgi:cytochrome c553
MMKRALLTAAALALLGTTSVVYAGGDAAAGKAKVAACAGCHGANGEGKDKNPPLAGKPEGELVKALNDYKSGKRANGMMKTFASKLSDQDMADVAAYYTSLKAK